MADEQNIRATLPTKHEGRRLLDRNRLPDPPVSGSGDRRGPLGRLERQRKLRVLAHVRRGVSFEHDRRLVHLIAARIVGQFADLLEILLPLLVGEPCHLEGAVGFDQTAGIVVNRLAGTRQQTGRGVVVAQDEL